MARKPTKKQAITYGSIVAVVSGFLVFIAFWDEIGGPVPLTKHSPVISAIKMDLDVQNVGMTVLHAKQRALEMDSLTRAMESDAFLLSQYDDRSSLDSGDHHQIARLNTKIRTSQARWDKLLEQE